MVPEPSKFWIFHHLNWLYKTRHESMSFKLTQNSLCRIETKHIGSPDSKRRKLQMDSKKMEWRWNNITDRIILRKEIICNIFCKEYSKRNVSEKPYSDIADITEKPFEPVKVKINGLRNLAGDLIKKINKSGQGCDEQWRSSWPFGCCYDFVSTIYLMWRNVLFSTPFNSF